MRRPPVGRPIEIPRQPSLPRGYVTLLLDRIPGGNDPGREPAQRLHDGARDALEIAAGFLIRRVDEGEAAALGRWEPGPEPVKTVALLDAYV